MAVNDTKNKNLKDFLIKTLADPVLIYTVIVMMSIMYHYREQLTVPYGIATFVIGWVIFRFFDFMKKHNLIGFFGYIILFMGVSWLTNQCIDKGKENYPIGWGLWFFTPQDSLEYNEWYTLALYLLFLIFMLSVIYYFTRVRYRILMNFIIFIIPFTIYGKEYEKMPTRYIILMAVGYILLMVNFRQLKENDKTVVVSKLDAWKSIAVFTVIFSLIAAIFPKPEIEANREYLETLINADAFTDRLVEMLNVFRDTSEGNQFRGNTSDTPVYYSNSTEPLRLKTSSFTNYNFSNDSWSISDYDKDYLYVYNSVPIDIYGNGNVAEGIMLSALLDSDFAEKYDIDTSVTLSIPENQTVSIYTANQGGQYAPVPQFARGLTEINYNDRIASIVAGTLFADGGNFGQGTNFTFTYSPDTFFYSSINRTFVDSLNRDDYAEMLSDAREVLSNAINSPAYADSNAIAECYAELSFNDNYYSSYTENLLDYGDSERIYELANEITAGAVSDYDKAKILEMYFYSNDYIYDLGYQKTRGDNAETFLFESKTGVCYEYATAMTLMARAVGIPARYCEGYNMQTEYGENNRRGYIVSSRDAHGFPELYIRGYGWMSFEPTITDGVAEEETATSKLSRVGVWIFVFALIALVFILLFPTIYHKLFLLKNKNREPNEAVKAVMKRICAVYGISKANTSHEAQSKVMEISKADISNTAEMFDRMVYGEETLDNNCRQKAIEEYVTSYNALKEVKKQNRKNKRKEKRVKT